MVCHFHVLMDRVASVSLVGRYMGTSHPSRAVWTVSIGQFETASARSSLPAGLPPRETYDGRASFGPGTATTSPALATTSPGWIEMRLIYVLALEITPRRTEARLKQEDLAAATSLDCPFLTWTEAAKKQPDRAPVSWQAMSALPPAPADADAESTASLRRTLT